VRVDESRDQPTEPGPHSDPPGESATPPHGDPLEPGAPEAPPPPLPHEQPPAETSTPPHGDPLAG
jgi:hypothetical protein